jgi:NADPH:quinone reductase
MKAITISSYGGPEVLTVTELPDPLPAADEVLIAVRAFGLNHAEAYMRSGAMGEVAKVTGIECAGTVVADPSGRLAEGTAVVAILGGMGRTRNGSYAELVAVPASNVVEVSTSLPWTDLVALPEVYATAWAGRVCQLGFLGGLEPVAGFNPIADLPSGVQFSFYGSAFVLGTSDFPLTEIPLTELIGKAESGLYQAKPAKVFGFDDIVEAHRVMESGLAGGKMTVSVT